MLCHLLCFWELFSLDQATVVASLLLTPGFPFLRLPRFFSGVASVLHGRVLFDTAAYHVVRVPDQFRVLDLNQLITVF